jgi:precorrin-6B methylase 2
VRGSDPSPRLETAARRWARDLDSWAIPEEIVRAAPASPWGFPPELFTASACSALEDREGTPSRSRALESLGGGGTVLDVGSGAGAASIPLVPPATHVTAVDEGEDMLRAFDDLAATRSVPHELVKGRWPDVAGRVASADVVVCHHVVYNVRDVVPFVRALNEHANRRVVMELTARHPQSDLNELWRELHGLERPVRPTADDLIEVLDCMGFAPSTERFRAQSLWAASDREAQLAFARRRLCAGPEHDARILHHLPTSAYRELVTVWWDHHQAFE